MRILMLSHGYPPIVSGVTLVVQKLARAMVSRGHDVAVVTSNDRGKPYEDDDEGVRLFREHSLHNPFWKEAPIPFVGKDRLAEIAGEVGPDLVHVHDAGFLGIQSLGCDRKHMPVRVTTCYYVPRFVARYLSLNEEPQPLVESLAWTYSIWLFNQFDHVVFATQAHEDFFVEKGLETATSIISNGIDVSRYRAGPGDGDVRRVEQRYRLPDGPRILFVGRIAPDKEIDVLIRAMPRICVERAAHLLIVGRGDDRERLEALVEELGVEACVHFLGFVPEEDMPALYRAVDLFAIASIYEVQSLPTLQAVATGTPVVAADAVALPELVHDGRNGFLVPPKEPDALAEAVLKILRDPALAKRMGEAGLESAQPHHETNTFDRYEALYQQMAGAPSYALPVSLSGRKVYGEQVVARKE